MGTIKLTDFRIQSYRSIIDSGWRSLASDNITILIGQNESGKTSVLEALHSFYTNILDEDALRSDNTYPKVSCRFVIDNKKKVADLLDITKLPEGLTDLIKKQNEFILTREWNSGKTSLLYISTDEVFDYFEKKRIDWKSTEEETRKAIEEILAGGDKVFSELQSAEKQLVDLNKLSLIKQKDLASKRKLLRKIKKAEEKRDRESEIDELELSLSDINLRISNYNEILQQLKVKSQELSEKISIGRTFKHHVKHKTDLLINIEDTKRHILELEHLFDLCTSGKAKQNAFQKLDLEKKQYQQLIDDIEKNDYQVKLVISTAIKIFQQGKSYNQAERESIQEISNSNLLYDQFLIGNELFNFIPRFVFFEDFSGLLPNKIDLEDILNENSTVEGYKAAINFVKVSGLDPSFFREKNNRILKQRIEALNSDVTINFQDYWSQQVGKDNKIKMQFELEHYDYTVPEKSGKPYLEFWIKDKQERLYPKQRSRGVRWFLSFYLELKAAAVQAESNLVLLIDEPGLSLHARAQEDVLKVFEDLKEKLQIIYCTHSPHLVKTEKLYRILAVQRADDDDDKSETLIYDPSMLSMATADTLTPIYALMGIRLSDQQLVLSKNNIIVPDIITYYYMHWLSKLSPELSSFRFIPATGLNTVPLLVNIMSGWLVNFGVILFGDKSKEVYNELKESSLLGINGTSSKIMLIEQYDTIEDIFSPVDFKKYILQQRIGITEKNSEFISLNSLSRKVLATNFVNNFTEGKIKMKEFDETTQRTLNDLFNQLLCIVQT